ncbi:MAG: hypothetical protein A2V76_02950 [Candidatus Aminicenantes bacterium RBG_16_63_14]|nr:MAG: hypothetical protein A2V76_02950 [Candidatus Aminicenantes bacterium RBG_16_63_14]
MMRKQDRKWPVILIGTAFVLAFVAAPALAAEKFEEKFEKTEALAVNGKLYLSNVSGQIEVATWKNAQVKIEALKTSKADTLAKAKENAGEVTIEVTKEGDLVRVETKYPKRSGGFWGGKSINVSVDYKIWVPDQAAVELKSVSGDVRVAPLGGKAKIGCVSGNIDLLGAAGADVDLVSGDLTLENIAGDAYLKAVSGNIKATQVKGSVEVEAVSGDIDLRDVSEAMTVNAKSISGNITYAGKIKAGGRYELKAHSGDVRMTIPADSAFDFEANTFSGSIDSDFEIQVVGKISPREIHGTVGKGGATVKLKSFSGNVDLRKR